MATTDDDDKVILTTEQLEAVLITFVETDCGRDCVMKVSVNGNRVDLAVRSCAEYTQCFLEKLRAIKVLN